MAGLGAGVAVSFLACPTELMKCRLQAQASVKGKSEVLALGFGTSTPFSKALPTSVPRSECYSFSLW